MKRLTPPIVLMVVCLVALGLRHGDMLGWHVPVIVPQTVTAAVIVEETADRPKLSKEVLGVLAIATKHNVKVVDKNVLDAGKYDKNGKMIEAPKTPTVLVPFFAAAKEKVLPQLVMRRGTDKYDSVACPNSEAALVEAIK